MSAKTFVDTNVLIYAHDIDAQAKHEIAKGVLRELWSERTGVLSMQVLQEFYVQATRTSRADAVPHELAAGLIEAWSRFRIQDMTFPVLNAAMRIRKAYGFSFWDSAIIGAALAQGCGRVYTEGLNHGQVIEGVRIVNPFL